MYAARMARVRANGIEIDYGEHGPAGGRPLVLLRGITTQRIAWPDVLLDDLAARGFRVLTPDNRDAGLTTAFDEAGPADVDAAFARVARGEPVDAPYTLEDMALDVVGLLDALGIAASHVAGMSMGGMIAQVLAARHPERTLSLCSIMSSSGRPGLPGPTPEAAEALIARPRSHAREDVVEHNLRSNRAFEGSRHRADPAWHRALFEASYDRSYRPDGFGRQALAVLASGSRVELLTTIRVPTLVVHGSEDALIPLEAGRDTAKHVPGAELLVVPGMGHQVVPSNSPVLAEALDAHARRVEEGAGR